jgi:hypothetical protein
VIGRTQHATATPADDRPTTDAVAAAVGLSKIYGTEQATVTALDDVTVDFGRAS